MPEGSKHIETPFHFLLKVLRANVWLYLLVTLPACIGLAFFLRNRPEYYLATVKIFAQTGLGRASGSSAGVEFERAQFIASQEELLNSYPLFRKVLIKYKTSALSKQYPFMSDSASLAPSTVRRSLAYVLGTSESASITQLSDAPYLSFLQNVTFEKKPVSGAFVIGYNDTVPEKAIAVAGFVADALLELNHDIMNKKKNNLGAYLREKLSDAEKRVQRSRIALSNFLAEHSLLDNPELVKGKINAYLSSVQNYDTAVRESAADDATLSATKEALSKVSSGLASEAAKHNERVQQLLAKILQFQTLLNSGDHKSEESAQLQRSMEESQEELNKELANDQGGLGVGKKDELSELQSAQMSARKNIAAKESELATLRRIKTQYEQEMKRMPRLQSQLQELLFTHSQNQKHVQMLSDSLLTLSTQGDAELTQLFSIDTPQITETVAKKVKLMAVGGISIFLFTALALGCYHMFRGTIYSIDDLRAAELPEFMFLGSIPRKNQRNHRRLVRSLGKNQSVTRACQILRGLLSRSQDRTEKSGKVVLMSSDSSNSGKSVTTLAMAYGLRDMQLGIMVFDCNFRLTSEDILDYAGKGSEREQFQYDDANSKFDPDWNPDREEITRQVTLAKLNIEASQSKQAHRYFSTNMAHELAVLRTKYDIILLDAAAHTFSDDLVLAGIVDVVIACCPEGKATKERFGQFVEQIRGAMNENGKLCVVMTNSRLT